MMITSCRLEQGVGPLKVDTVAAKHEFEKAGAGGKAEAFYQLGAIYMGDHNEVDTALTGPVSSLGGKNAQVCHVFETTRAADSSFWACSPVCFTIAALVLGSFRSLRSPKTKGERRSISKRAH